MPTTRPNLMTCLWHILPCVVIVTAPAPPPSTSPTADETAEAALNDLAIGLNDCGAVLYLLRKVPGKLLYKGGAPTRQLGAMPTGVAGEFDFLHMLESESGKKLFFLFSKEGFLVAKCHQSRQSRGSVADVYAREIASGNQHPPRRTGAERKAAWGGPATVQEHPKDREAAPVTRRGQLRCGAVWLDPAEVQGSNLLVMIRNDDTVEFREYVSGEQFILGGLNQIEVFDPTSGRGIAHLSLGLDGSAYFRIGDAEPTRFGLLRLRPGESMFFSFTLPPVELQHSVAARASVLAADESGHREYVVVSGTLQPQK